MSIGRDMLPLWRRRVVVTRPRSRASSWVSGFAAAGAEVVLFPVFEFLPATAADEEQAIQALRRIVEGAALQKADSPWVVFTSVPGVEHFLAVVEREGERATLGKTRLACVGPSTRRALEDRGYGADLVPAKATAADVAGAILAGTEGPPRVLHPTCIGGLATIEEAVKRSGGEARRVSVYRQERLAGLDPDALARVHLDEGIDLLTFASPSAARTLLSSAAAKTAALIRNLPALAVGPTTADALDRLGFANVGASESPQVDAVVRAATRLVETTAIMAAVTERSGPAKVPAPVPVLEDSATEARDLDDPSLEDPLLADTLIDDPSLEPEEEPTRSAEEE